MVEKHRTVVVVFLLCVIADVAAQVTRRQVDVCSTCHVEAVCDDKSDGSGKVCNCKYGFAGNGRTICVDKDECQIEATMCGPHTICHNTYGSYSCSCLAGYSPSNNININTFIPNDGTYCQDIDECRITGQCGEGAQCRNLEGSFDCSCQLGYRVHNGEEPFNPSTSNASCKEVDCGQPVSIEDTELLSVTGTTYNNVAMFACDKGLVWRSGDRNSVCGADGRWTRPTMVCEEVDCGSPPDLPHSHMLWNKSSRRGTKVVYRCNSGYINVGKGNESICTAAGHWDSPSMLCQEVMCGSPPVIESTEQVWDGSSAPGSSVLYVCNEGFYHKGGRNISTCKENGQWTPPTLSCQAILCGDPPTLPHTGRVWDGSSTPGSKVTYDCKLGFYHSEGNNVSLCRINGYWTKPNISCKEIDCGAPPPIPHSVMLWDKIPTWGSQVVYQCNSGYRSVGERNVSVCTASGEWDAASLHCQAILCGDPPTLPHTGRVWDGSSTPGSKVTYDCKLGFYHSEGNNVSLCTINGYWTKPNISCKEIDCGAPPPIPHSVMLWDKIPTWGSQVVYQCNSGYRSVGERNVSVCTASGEWDAASLRCQEITCQEPVNKPHTNMLWDGTSHIGSVVSYRCEEGFNPKGLRNYSVCGQDGLWEDIDLWCEEISCGPPLTLPHTNPVWDGATRPGSVVLYECMDGFYQESGNNISRCLLSGHWGKVSLKCKAKCGPVPFIANSEVMWHNKSVVSHRCVDGYHSWRGSNVSVCGSSGGWQRATLRCIEIKPPVNHLLVLNETCLHWRAEKYEEDTEVYKVTYVGSRDYQRSFRDRRNRSLSSKADQLELCLNLLPATNYSIYITAVSSRFTSTITINTSLSVPPAPVVYYREFETPVPTLRLRRSPNTLDSISVYQVFVLPLERIIMFDCSSPASSDSSTEYITAQIDVRHVGTEMNFTVGDGLYYEGFFNAPLENGRNYYIVLRAVSQWKSTSKSSCVLWAKVRGTSYVLKVTALAAAASVGAVVLVIWSGYGISWLFKRTRPARLSTLSICTFSK